MNQLQFKKCDAFYADDRRSLVILLTLRVPVVSNSYAHFGHVTMRISPPDPKCTYLNVGREAGLYDLQTASDVNSFPGGPDARFTLLGREMLKVYGQVGSIDRKDAHAFGRVMTFRSEDSFQNCTERLVVSITIV